MNFAFLIKSALLLALLYGGFALLLSRETFHRFNRLALLTAMIASLVLPAIQLTMDKPSFLRFEEDAAEQTLEMNAPTQEMEEDISLYQEPISTAEETEIGQTISINAEQVCSLLYLIGMIGSVGFFLFQLFRFWRDTKGGTSTKDEEGNTIVIRGGEFSPYSFLHYIIISVSDYERLRKPILAHEQAHIRLGHSWDLLLLEAVKAVQWFNPFVYLLGRDLKAVHEYEADNAVLNQGIDAKTYQLLLVTKAVGNRLQTLGNNLSHHSLKKRIKMMHKNNSNRWMMTKGIVLPALMALAVVAFAKPKVESIPVTEESTEPTVANITTTPEVNTEVSLQVNIDSIYNRVEENAQFPGGDAACLKWVADHLKYPEECVDKGIQGRVYVQFVVNKDGSITDVKVLKSPSALLSEETIRVVKAMPKWKPAKDKGKVVRSRFNLPVMFKIPKTVVTGEGTPAEPVANNDSIYTVVDEIAQFPGGDAACMKWLADHIKYPEDCKKEGIEGRVYLSFVVEKDGSITNVKAIRSPHASLSEEGERVVKAMPKWKTAKAKGEIVRQRFMLPILFRLPKESNQNNT